MTEKQLFIKSICEVIRSLFQHWQGKLMLAVVLTVAAQVIEQFCSSFGADTLLLLFLLGLVFVDLILGFVAMLKTRNITAGGILQGVLKLPLYCLYLFLVGVVSISLEHSVQIGLPILNTFIGYLIACEVFSIVLCLKGMGVEVPYLLVYMATELRDRVEAKFKKTPIKDKNA